MTPRFAFTGAIAALSVLAAHGTAAARPGDAPGIDAAHMPLVHTTDARYQSFQIGFSHLTGGETWKAYGSVPSEVKDFSQVREARQATDLGSRRLRNLTAALAPLYIRFSGTTANSVYFHDSDAPPPAQVPPGFTVTLTRARWKLALDFARGVDAKVVTSFANSEGVRGEAHAWTPRMAAPWMAYTRAIGGSIHAAELFNEPNAPEPPNLPRGFTASEFARDYAVFRESMARIAPGVKLAGPGIATLGIPGVASIGGVSAEDYASASPQPRFDIVSYHFYPVLAQRCAPETSPQGISADHALDDEFLARPDKRFAEIKALRDRHAPGAPIWLTETGGAACGGLVWQPTFLDVFRYLDTHARLARQGLDAIFTHALISGSNGVIDEKTLEPNASYWAAVLWRRLMGARVLDAGAAAPGLRLYAHCQRQRPGGVTLLAINTGASAQSLRVGNAAEVYALTAPELRGRTVLLNGRPLAIGADDRLPAMKPVRAKGRTIAIAPTSVAFIALPLANNSNCRKPESL